jgi:hypothetical protein
MRCKEIREKFIDFLTGEIEEISKAQVQSHISSCASCREELEGLSEIWTKLGVLPEEKPSKMLRTRFYDLLQAYKQGLEPEKAKPRLRLGEILEVRFSRFWPKRPAWQFVFSLSLLFIGLAAGFFLNFNGKRAGEMVQLRQDVQNMRQTLAVSLLDQSSPSERLRGVSLSYSLEKPGERILEALLNTLNNDPNINVRLAAVDALYLFYQNPTVKEGLIHSLSLQTSPLVQAALIDLMVSLRERQAIDSLQRLLADEKLNPDVKQKAEQGIKQLSF